MQLFASLFFNVKSTLESSCVHCEDIMFLYFKNEEFSGVLYQFKIGFSPLVHRPCTRSVSRISILEMDILCF